MVRASIRKAGRPPGGVNGQRVRDYPQVSIRVPPKLHAQLATLIRQTGRRPIIQTPDRKVVRKRTSPGTLGSRESPTHQRPS